MTERHLDNSPEKLSPIEAGTEHDKRLQESLEAKAAAAEHLDVGELSQKAKEAAPLSREYSTSETAEDTSQVTFWQSKELRTQAFKRVLTSTRARLSAPERQFSKVIHQPAIEKVSELAGKTVARPSGILVGGILSFFGSLIALVVAKRIGGEFRYSIFAFTFVFGFTIGLIVELLWRLVHRTKH